MDTVIIKGSEWDRGHKGGPISLLVLEDDTKCCFGIAACQVWGYDAETIKAGRKDAMGALRSYYYPTDLPGFQHKFPELFIKMSGMKMYPDNVPFNISHEQNPFVVVVGNINDCGRADNVTITDDERIEMIRPFFLELGLIIDWRPNE